MFYYYVGLAPTDALSKLYNVLSSFHVFCKQILSNNWIVSIFDAPLNQLQLNNQFYPCISNSCNKQFYRDLLMKKILFNVWERTESKLFLKYIWKQFITYVWKTCGNWLIASNFEAQLIQWNDLSPSTSFEWLSLEFARSSSSLLIGFQKILHQEYTTFKKSYTLDHFNNWSTTTTKNN